MIVEYQYPYKETNHKLLTCWSTFLWFKHWNNIFCIGTYPSWNFLSEKFLTQNYRTNFWPGSIDPTWIWAEYSLASTPVNYSFLLLHPTLHCTSQWTVVRYRDSYQLSVANSVLLLITSDQDIALVSNIATSHHSLL